MSFEKSPKFEDMQDTAAPTKFKSVCWTPLDVSVTIWAVDAFIADRCERDGIGADVLQVRMVVEVGLCMGYAGPRCLNCANQWLMRFFSFKICMMTKVGFCYFEGAMTSSIIDCSKLEEVVGGKIFVFF
ncbi:hypothetical protein BpHYR1_021366 [Brachionus plicatilis]|uniref:Uncharacterized protein n=1 Tax=Brachionus plicatilis TaxID=10195 RepID=A0A3M7Q7D6_BRAPC|nr:hypothetical protein BpHYR1_021366 [Brachionus plicatilis]